MLALKNLSHALPCLPPYMANPKDKYYWSQLRAALTAGQWSAPFPGKAPNGTALSWSELLRKFNKHCPGFRDIANIASQTQALALLLAADSKDEDQDDTTNGSYLALSLSEECLLPEERIEEAKTGYETLKKLETTNFDTLNFALAYYAYALGIPSDCLSYLNEVSNVAEIQSRIPTPAATRSSTLAPPSTFDASSWTGSFTTDSSGPINETRDGKAWALTEALRSLCLKGMAHEKLFPGVPETALKTYFVAIPLLTVAESDIASNTAPLSGAGKLDFTSFHRFRELWRWIERLIWRAVILASQTSDIYHDADVCSLWTWVKHYTACSAYWPPTFRTQHRSTILVLHLRALVLRASSIPLPSSLSYQESGKPPAWLHTGRSAIHEYRAILSVSTTFPRAGERNIKVEDFVDLCVAVWEASGAIGDHAGWVIDVLWWATRLTFNSYRILRHMTRLLYVSGDVELAKRTLKLYVQVVGKAYEASDAGVGADADTDQHWVETLVQGARMLCRVSSTATGLDGIKDVKEAGILVEKAKKRLDRKNIELTASLDLAEGVWSSVMALHEQNPLTRSSRLAHSHNLFLRSVEAFPTSSSYFHLALSFARPGLSQNLDQAILNAGLAVEGEPKDIRYWHLLGLLLAAAEKWSDAERILETGASIGESNMEADSHEASDSGNNLTVPSSDDRAISNGVLGKDFGASSVNGGTSISAIDGLPNSEPSPLHNDDRFAPPPLSVIGKHAVDIPPAAELLRPTLDHPPPSRHEVFEHALQLRMTQVALAEYVEGAEGAEVKWVDLFTWFAESTGVTSDRARNSIDGRVSTDKSPSELALHVQPDQENMNRSLTPHHPQSDVLLSPPAVGQAAPLTSIPITISPATPDDHSYAFPKNELEQVNEKRSFSIDRDTSKSKKVQQMLKNRVHKGRAGISTISKKIGNGVARNGSLRRSSSTPDFHAVLHHTSYQASSIHSRRRVSSIIRQHDTSPNGEPLPPPPMLPPTQQKSNKRTQRENRLLSDLWLMSAATFRRFGKIEQAKGAIQEAEVKDESNPGVWVQLGLYYTALGRAPHAIDAFHKALFINPDDVSASVHLCRLYLSPEGTAASKAKSGVGIDPDNVDLAAGTLSHLTSGSAWDVPEAWYFLAKAYRLQDRKDQERECLRLALALSETRSVREIGTAIGWCI